MPYGITGFYRAGEAPPPEVDGKQFKRICFELALQHKGKIIQFTSPAYPINFYNVQVEIKEKQFFMLLNKHYPYLAFASEISDTNITFIDIPALYDQLTSNYTVFKTDELSQPMHKFKSNHSLSSAEISQIDWVHDKVGHVIFNFFD
ncbi:hypothetical protein [Gracilibacillus salinarum]|uniref:Uncharacterized protein n=1 Tax=Gracilibacillus salinarum TaxID=2932255 RepID=A0ABY4GKD1_9BACI|nr:hypothetical protein [Gracilibacillus salinarum]UOQ84684.1 hypothetical protein MUN87_18800 [Gracilibacillus salinarum]